MADTGNSRILVWYDLPEINNKPADFAPSNILNNGESSLSMKTTLQINVLALPLIPVMINGVAFATMILAISQLPNDVVSVDTNALCWVYSCI